MRLSSTRIEHNYAYSCGATSRPKYVRQVALVAFLLILAAYLLQPLSAFATVNASDEVLGKPYQQLDISSSLMPDVSLDAGILTTKNGEVLWSRNATKRHHIASITKVMTAIVVLEHAQPEDEMTVPRMSVTVGESTAGLKAGEKLSMKNLLASMLVKSGNDAATALAINVAGSLDEFVALMNKKAQDLGMTETHFSNPHGLDSEGQYSCARDVSIMSRYAMQYDTFREIVSDKLYTFTDATTTHKLPNTNLLLWKYPDSIGIKTGWTDKAGYCLSSAANKNGIELYSVVLGTKSEMARFEESISLLDFGYAHYRTQEIAVKGSQIGSAKVKDYPNKYVAGEVATDVAQPVFDLAGDITRQVKTSTVSAPVKKGQTIGVVQFTQEGKMIASVPLVAKEQVDKPFILLQPIYWIMQKWQEIFTP